MWKAIKHTERHSTSLTIREMQTKTTMSYTTHLMRMAEIILAVPNTGEKLDLSQRSAKWYSHSGSLAVFDKVKHNLYPLTAIPCLGIYPREMKTYVHIKAYI